MGSRIQLTPGLKLVVAFIVTSIGVASFILLMRPTEGDLIIRMDPTTGEIAVEIRGQITNPGLYRLAEGSRVGDLIALAGGILPTADLSATNLAQRLVDEDMIVILAKSAPTQTPVAAATPISGPASISFRIDINTASQPDLESLPGIGPVLAARIIEHRTTNGRFTSVDELTEIDGISASLVDDIRSLVTVGS